MNDTSPHRLIRRGLLGGAAVMLTLPLLAQEARNSRASETNAEKPEEPIVLSPFNVTTSKDRGYFAENTLAGSRMNTNVSDLGASISVITKQLLEDTASVDINDVFRYEINTEGSLTYTPAENSFRNDGVLDVIAGGSRGGSAESFTNATANRIRGVDSPSFAINNYPAISAVPLDTYNVQRLEISRGPNSMLFGMGSPAGVVNQSSSEAVLNGDKNTVMLRTDHNGSFRSSFSLNRTLIKDRLAVFGAVLYSNEQFERKPSYDISRRAYGAIKVKPFAKTTIRASVEEYLNKNRRPNSMTPRDFITEWRLSGQPVYDSATQMVTITATGQQIGPYVVDAAHPSAQQLRNYIMSRSDYDPSLRNVQNNNTFSSYNGVSIFGAGAMTNTASILFVPGLGVPSTRNTMQIAGGEVLSFFQPTFNSRPVVAWGTAANPRNNTQFPASNGAVFANPIHADVFNRMWVSSAGRPGPADVGNFQYAGVTDRSVYDWENININEMNFGRTSNTTFNVELDQEIFDNLHLSLGWFRQDFLQHTNYTVSQLNATALFIDPNVRLPDGSPNPMFGKPYVEDDNPDRYRHTQLNDSYRAMLAYTPDFTRRSDWLRWLGRHQVLGMWSRDESDRSNWRMRPAFVNGADSDALQRFVNNQLPNANGSDPGWAYQQGNVFRRWFYLANQSDPFGSSVTRSAGQFNNLDYTGNVRGYDYRDSRFEDYNVTWRFNTFDSPNRSQRLVDSISAGITSYLWNDRLITTFGVRKDKFKARLTTTNAYVDEGGVAHPALTVQEKFDDGLLNTDLVLNRWNIWDRLTGTTRTAGGVFRPFRNWSGIDRRADGGSLLWQFIRDFGVSYNQSDNFNPPPAAQVDLFGNFLPKPMGEGKDYGFQFSLFDNKVFARVTWFESNSLNQRAGATSTLNRVRNSFDINQYRAWAYTIARINLGDDPRVNASWDVEIPADRNEQIEAAAEKIFGLPYDYYSSLPGEVGMTRDIEAKGMEAQLNYNPTRNWTLRATFGKQDTVNNNVLKEIDAWLLERMPLWTTARAADHLLPQYQNLATYQTEGGRQVDLTNFWNSYGYTSDVRDDNRFGWTTQQNYFNGSVSPGIRLDRDLQGQKVKGQRRYRASVMTNYKFTEGWLKGFDLGGVERWEDKMIIGYYGAASGSNTANPARLDISDLSRPIYDSANFYTDVWIGYTRRLFNDRVQMRLQLNVANVFEDGELRVVNVDYEGRANAFRIIDPRKYTLTATFDF